MMFGLMVWKLWNFEVFTNLKIRKLLFTFILTMATAHGTLAYTLNETVFSNFVCLLQWDLLDLATPDRIFSTIGELFVKKGVGASLNLMCESYWIMKFLWIRKLENYFYSFILAVATAQGTLVYYKSHYGIFRLSDYGTIIEAVVQGCQVASFGWPWLYLGTLPEHDFYDFIWGRFSFLGRWLIGHPPLITHTTPGNVLQFFSFLWHMHAHLT